MLLSENIKNNLMINVNNGNNSAMNMWIYEVNKKVMVIVTIINNKDNTELMLKL